MKNNKWNIIEQFSASHIRIISQTKRPTASAILAPHRKYTTPQFATTVWPENDKWINVEQNAYVVYGYLSRKVSFLLFKIFEILKGRTFNFDDILRLCCGVLICEKYVGAA